MRWTMYIVGSMMTYGIGPSALGSVLVTVANGPMLLVGGILIVCITALLMFTHVGQSGRKTL